MRLALCVACWLGVLWACWLVFCGLRTWVSCKAATLLCSGPLPLVFLMSLT